MKMNSLDRIVARLRQRNATRYERAQLTRWQKMFPGQSFEDLANAFPTPVVLGVGNTPIGPVNPADAKTRANGRRSYLADCDGGTPGSPGTGTPWAVPANILVQFPVGNPTWGEGILPRYLLVKLGSDDRHVQPVSATTDEVIGVAEDNANSQDDPITVALLGVATGTVLMMVGAFGVVANSTSYGVSVTAAANTIPAGALVASNGDGTVKAAAQNDRTIGRALTGGFIGDWIEVAHCIPNAKAA